MKELLENVSENVPAELFQYHKNAYNEFDRPAVKGSSCPSKEKHNIDNCTSWYLF